MGRYFRFLEMKKGGGGAEGVVEVLDDWIGTEGCGVVVVVVILDAKEDKRCNACN